jgi:predicted alpha-1,2-mannosidase
VKKISLLLIIVIRVQLFGQSNFATNVNPFIGTGGHGHTFPGPTLPFGMVQLSPDTRIDGSWDGCGGYHYSDSIIYGFTHTHLSGTGVSDWGDILIMPTINEPSFDNKVYSSKFSHSNEKASAGYYEVMLDADKIKSQLTTTLRTGIHKYSFPKTDKANIILDLLHRDKTLACNIKVLDSVTISGFRISEAWAKEQHVYFIMKFSKPFKKMAYAYNKIFFDSLNKKKRELAQGGYFQFDVSDGQPLLVKVALSPTNTDGALRNMNAEATHWDFDKYKTDAEKAWNKELSKIEIKDNNTEKLNIFYTALYHCMIHPSINMDVDGQYRGRDNKLHQAENYTYYNVFSLWDTYRALHPLLTIIDKQRTRDFIFTFLHQYDQGRRLPVWELSSNETECMIGYHSVSVIADAFIKGIVGYDTVVIYQAMKAAANHTAFGQPSYLKNGYLQIDDEPESVSKTLEYAYDDWCIAQVAQKLGKSEDFIQYMKRAQSYKNLFDPSTGFMRPRKNGNWLSPFDPAEVNNHYTEANSWQYSFYVPQDLDVLIRLHGEAGFEKKLDDLFSADSKTTGRDQADITGLIGQYAHGNEPSHHMAYLYNYIGKPQKTIALTNKICNEFYKNAPDGLIGNEDCGQMSAWYVFSSMGFYPVTPGFPLYTLSSPFFNEIKINLEDGKSFEIVKSSSGASENLQLTGISINSKKIYRSAIPHKLIENGGKMIFDFAQNPDSVIYGSKMHHRPHTRISNFPIIISPIIKSESKSFKEKQEIRIENLSNQKVNVVYTIDGTEPTKKSPLYFKPFTIDSTCTIKTKIYSEKDSSNTTTAHFYRMPHNWKLTLKSKYNKQYSAGGDDGIIDGVYGETNWRKGEWQGYQGQDFEAIIDLGKEQTVQVFKSNYLQDTRSWILFPSEIEYFTSADGKKFKSVGKIINPVAASDYAEQLKNFEYHLPKPEKSRYVKVVAKNYGKLPDWHQGVGGDAFIFIDEIEVK